MSYRSIAEFSVLRRLGSQSVISFFSHSRILCSVRFSFQRVIHFLNEIINKEHFEFNTRIIHRNRQIIGNVVAERSHSAVVIGTDPFSHQVRKTVYVYSRAGFICVPEKEIFPVPLGQPIFGCSESAGQGGL